MSNVVKIGFEINIQDTRFVLNDRLGHALYRIMGGALRAVSIRPLLEIGFKDRLQDELESSLDHTVPNRRDRQDTLASAVVLRDRLTSVPGALIRTSDQFISY